MVVIFIIFTSCGCFRGEWVQSTPHVHIPDIDIWPLFLIAWLREVEVTCLEIQRKADTERGRNKKQRETSLWGPYDFPIPGFSLRLSCILATVFCLGIKPILKTHHPFVLGLTLSVVN